MNIQEGIILCMYDGETLRPIIVTDAADIALEAAEKAAEAVYRMVQKARPLHVTQKQAAEMLGVSQAKISNMVKFGTFKLNATGLIPIEQVDKAFEAKESG